jgi:hypothetical protein
METSQYLIKVSKTVPSRGLGALTQT